MSTALVHPQQDQLSSQTAYWIEIAEHTAITDHASYEMAAAHLQAIKELMGEADQSFDPIISKAYAAHKEACAQKKRITEPLLQAEALLKRSIGAYVQEQDRLRRDEERRQREEADRLAAEEREREIEAAEALGVSAEEIAVITEAPLRRPPVVVAAPSKVQGISCRETWKAEVTNLQALVKYVATHPEFLSLLQANMPALNGLARSLRSAMNIPGVKVYAEQNIAARRTN